MHGKDNTFGNLKHIVKDVLRLPQAKAFFPFCPWHCPSKRKTSTWQDVNLMKSRKHIEARVNFNISDPNQVSRIIWSKPQRCRLLDAQTCWETLVIHCLSPQWPFIRLQVNMFHALNFARLLNTLFNTMVFTRWTRMAFIDMLTLPLC